MVTLDRESQIPVQIVRGLEVVFTCITFSLVASVYHYTGSYWTWCMFAWCLCFSLSLIILVLELSGLYVKLPISWPDFTCAFAMLATLMTLSVSIIYPIHYTCTPSICPRQVGASVCSCVAFILYAIELGMIRAKPGEVSGFLTTTPGLLKVKEVYAACIIFINLDSGVYRLYPGMQWCVAVYSICFIFSFVIILLTIGRLLTLFPAPLKKVLTFVNVLAVLMYITAVVVWPVYGFKFPYFKYTHDRLVVVTFMSCLNLLFYIVDTVHSVRLNFFVSST